MSRTLVLRLVLVLEAIGSLLHQIILLKWLNKVLIGLLRLIGSTKVDVHGKRLILPVVLERAIKASPARLTEWLLLLVRELLIQTPQQALIVDAHGLEEVHLELLAVSAELSCQSIPLALQLFLGDFERA